MILETVKRQQAILEAAHEVILTISLDERLTYSNKAGRCLLAIPEQQDLSTQAVYVQGLHSAKTYLQLQEDIFPQVIAAAEIWRGDLEFISLGGKKIPANVTLVPHTDTQGKVEGITCLLRDLRALKNHEAMQRLAVRVFESTIEGIMVTDGKAKILQVNSAFSEITGYQPHEVIGRTPSILRSNHHDAEFYAAMWQSIAAHDSWQGEIWNRRKDGSVYLQWLSLSCIRNDDNEIENYISVIHDLSELRAKDAEIQHLAHHDILTGLGNRHQLHSRLRQAIRNAKSKSEQLALLLIDLGQIQNLNETFGHSWCDKLIREQSSKLNRIKADADTLVRTGADEFALLVENYVSTHDITQLAARIKTRLQQPVTLEGKEVSLSPSLGIAFFPVDGLTADSLLANAQTALSDAKNSGRNTFRFFDHRLSEEARKRLQLEQALRSAIKGEGLSLNFQPKIQLSDKKICGVEALLRWQHPELGPMSPAVFIPLAEESGLIKDIGAWVVEEACRNLVRWRQQGFKLPRVAINIAVQQLEQEDFAAWLEQTILQQGLSLDNFELEVTETGLMSNERCALDTLAILKHKGFRIALDDFGTGYSSLSYLRKLPLSTLKIDRSFIQDMSCNAVSLSIVQTIVQLAHKINLDLVAEGVEEEAQAQQLLSMGCRLVQGFLYYRPLPETELIKLLDQDS